MSKSFEQRMKAANRIGSYTVNGQKKVAGVVPIQDALAIAREADALRKTGCWWRPYPADGPMPCCYDTTCGQIHYLSEGNLADNHYKYCPYCGGEIEGEKA
jgi:hypothetical protein